MNCRVCQARMAARQKVCSDCGWISGESNGPACMDCASASPARRHYHWLSLPPRDLESHIDIRDKIEKPILIHWILETRSRCSGRVDENGAPMHPCDAWKLAMMQAQADRDAPFDEYHKAHCEKYNLIRDPHESKSEYIRRCLDIPVSSTFSHVVDDYL